MRWNRSLTTRCKQILSIFLFSPTKFAGFLCACVRHTRDFGFPFYFSPTQPARVALKYASAASGTGQASVNNWGKENKMFTWPCDFRRFSDPWRSRPKAGISLWRPCDAVPSLSLSLSLSLSPPRVACQLAASFVVLVWKAFMKNGIHV
jgi:hypothetical protein